MRDSYFDRMNDSILLSAGKVNRSNLKSVQFDSSRFDGSIGAELTGQEDDDPASDALPSTDSPACYPISSSTVCADRIAVPIYRTRQTTRSAFA